MISLTVFLEIKNLFNFTGKTIFIDDINDLIGFRKRGLIGAPSLSFIPTDAGPTEVFVQMSFTKKSIE